MTLSRRSFLRGLVAAPAVVKASSLMPVRLWRTPQIYVARTGPFLYEAMVFDRGLSFAEQQLVEGYLASKFGMADVLPSEHPYKTVLPDLSGNGHHLVGDAPLIMEKQP